MPLREIEFAKNNILMSDAEINLLRDRILEINSSEWEEISLIDKTKKFKGVNNDLAISLKEYAVVVGMTASPAKAYRLNTGFVLLAVLIIFLIWKFRKTVFKFSK